MDTKICARRTWAGGQGQIATLRCSETEINMFLSVSGGVLGALAQRPPAERKMPCGGRERKFETRQKGSEKWSRELHENPGPKASIHQGAKPDPDTGRPHPVVMHGFVSKYTVNLSLYQPKTATALYTSIAPMMIAPPAVWLICRES